MKLNRLLLVICLLTSPMAGAAKWHVAQWGADTFGCGSTSSPCQSISVAAAFAGPNDRIVVQPGIYDENVTLDQPGMRLESVAGQHGTVIESSGPSVISVTANKVRVGKKGRGFTLKGGSNNFLAGVRVEPGVESGVRIEGNRILDSYYGILTRGDKTVVRYNTIVDTSSGAAIFCRVCTRYQIMQNRVRSSSAQGILIEGSSNGLVRENRIFNTGGASMLPAIELSSALSLFSVNNRLRDNVVSGGTGTAIDAPVSGANGLEIQANILAETADGVMLINDAAHAKGATVRDNIVARVGTLLNATGLSFASNGLGPAYVVSGNQVIATSGDAIDSATDAEFSKFQNNTTYASGSGWGIVVAPGNTLNYGKHFWGGTPEFDMTAGLDAHDGLQSTGATVSGTSTNKPGPVRISKAAKL